VGSEAADGDPSDVGGMRRVLPPVVDSTRGSGDAPPPAIRRRSLRTPHTD